MSTSVNSQTNAIIAKDILIAAISGDRKSIHVDANPAKGAAEIAEAFAIIYAKVSSLV